MSKFTKAGLGWGRSITLCAAVLGSMTANAELFNTGKVLATGGVSMVDGAGGGGITPWATITGYATRDGINGDLHYTYVFLPDYQLQSLGGAMGFWDRFELSYTQSILTTGGTYDTVGLVTDTLGADTGIEPFNTTITMDVYGAKVRVFGDAIYDSDNLIPQIAIGAFYKENKNEELLTTLHAEEADGWEYYIAATKIFFPFNTLFNYTLRYTDANQTGLTGFGGPNSDGAEFRSELSVGYLLRKDTVIGFEWTQHGENTHGSSVELTGLDVGTLQPVLELAGLGDVSHTLTQRESDWFDAFIAYFPNKNFSMTFAYANLGDIVITPDQHGFYLSLQASF